MKPNSDTNQVKFEFGFQMPTNQFMRSSISLKLYIESS